MLERNIMSRVHITLSYLIHNIAIGLCLILVALNAHANMQTALLDTNTTSASANKYQDNLVSVLNNSGLALINEVNQLYQLRDYNLIWSNGQEYNQNAHELYEVIRNADEFGLSPKDYDAEMIAYLLESTIDDSSIVSKSDITFTHAYVKLASHIESGKFINFNSITEDQYPLIETLNDAVNSHSVTIALENLQLSTTNYAKIVSVLKKYRSLYIDDNFDSISLDSKSLTIGDQSIEIIKLRKRLHDLGDYSSNDLNDENLDLHSNVLDESLVEAISKFQIRHGLKADGALGKKTVNELNKPIAYRIRQLELNLERARQLPELKQGRHLVVNIPDYSLYLVNDGVKVYESRVVVGKTKHKTPVLTSELTQLVLNPYWNIPKSISNNEILPKLLSDPNYLYRNNMKVLGTINNQTQVINPETIDWTNIDFYNASLRIRQDPGAMNSLGKIKFIFPNNYNVYLHDTPARSLFARNQRALSHGCVRLEDPIGLAKILLSTTNHTSNDIDNLIQRNKRKSLKLEQPIPIHITYMTAWVNEQGIVNFRPDIYKRDSQIADNLYNASR